ncbi:MAG: TerB N-terminal domain-containing protein [Oscillospiraceae bacterium]|nr:TerB N-terminal domain-containing protein [Oscillospiraceae bacterium]
MDDMFYEIEYDSRAKQEISPKDGLCSSEGRILPSGKAQSLKLYSADADETKERFYKMRELARSLKARRRLAYDFAGLYKITGRNYNNSDSLIFCKQGEFMSDFSDNYCDYKDFSEKYPSYQLMGYEQLRTYFTWRVKVRNGEICRTSLSYALVYAYELLNNIGVTDEARGINTLMSFWQNYRVRFPELDKYIPKWLKEYHDYYDLSDSFENFVSTNRLEAFYPESSLCNSDDLAAWNKVSSYDITKSRFWINECEKNELIKNCFEFVIRILKQRINFKELLFSPISFEREPFKDALFHNKLNKSITMKRLFITDSGKSLVGYILKKVEACIRAKVNYNYKLKTDLGEFDTDIEKAVDDYFIELNRVEVEVNLNNLERIREEATATQEKLIVEEEKPDASKPLIDTLKKEPILHNENPFNETEVKALSFLLSGEKSILQFANETGIMPEVLVGDINEKAYDMIGDNLLDDEFNIYEDYTEQIKGLLI